MSTKTGGLQSLLFLTFAFTTGSLLMGHSSHVQAASPNQAPEKQATPISIGGEPVVTLDRPLPANPTKLQFIQATIVPGNGMNLLQLKAFLPGKGPIDVLTTMPLPEAKKYLDTDNDSFGNNSFKLGGAILLPYPNRIRGTLAQDGMTLQTTIDGHQVTLPANWKGKNPGAEVHAMHGLILSSDFKDVKHENGPKESTVSAVLHAGNFGGHWLSDTDVYVQMTLKNDAVDIVVTAKNVGKEPLPMAIGAHPYFSLPSGDRAQARLHVPAEKRVLVDNYDNVFPTGQIESVKGTPYDFNAAAGKPLGSLFLDECFTDLQRDAEGRVVVNVTDPAANYGVRITALSPDIKAIQVYSPPDKDFVAVEPQFNLSDPYNKKIWGNTDTGVVTVAPGKSVSWHVRLELFTPGK
ncbi:MAG: aldose 1-epimerase [Candidatus Acidiferrales bacterium]